MSNKWNKTIYRHSYLRSTSICNCNWYLSNILLTLYTFTILFSAADTSIWRVGT